MQLWELNLFVAFTAASPSFLSPLDYLRIPDWWLQVETSSWRIDHCVPAQISLLFSQFGENRTQAPQMHLTLALGLTCMAVKTNSHFAPWTAFPFSLPKLKKWTDSGRENPLSTFTFSFVLSFSAFCIISFRPLFPIGLMREQKTKKEIHYHRGMTGPVWMTALFAREKAMRRMTVGYILSSQNPLRSGSALSTMPTIHWLSFPFTTEQFIVSSVPFHFVLSSTSPPDFFWLPSLHRSLDMHLVTAFVNERWREWKKKEREWDWCRNSFQFLKREHTATFLP